MQARRGRDNASRGSAERGPHAPRSPAGARPAAESGRRGVAAEARRREAAAVRDALRESRSEVDRLKRSGAERRQGHAAPAAGRAGGRSGGRSTPRRTTPSAPSASVRPAPGAGAPAPGARAAGPTASRGGAGSAASGAGPPPPFKPPPPPPAPCHSATAVRRDPRAGPYGQARARPRAGHRDRHLAPRGRRPELPLRGRQYPAAGGLPCPRGGERPGRARPRRTAHGEDRSPRHRHDDAGHERTAARAALHQAPARRAGALHLRDRGRGQRAGGHRGGEATSRQALSEADSSPPRCASCCASEARAAARSAHEDRGRRGWRRPRSSTPPRSRTARRPARRRSTAPAGDSRDPR